MPLPKASTRHLEKAPAWGYHSLSPGIVILRKRPHEIRPRMIPWALPKDLLCLTDTPALDASSRHFHSRRQDPSAGALVWWKR
jgi:hypothetical protein